MPIPDGFVHGAPRALLRLEGAAMLAAATVVYARIGSTWWLFATLFLFPDASMLGYCVGPKTGAACYNAAHTLLAPAVLAGLGDLLGSPLAFPLAAIWVAHIGMDHLLGYGLKYETGFADTHLGPLGAATKDGRTGLRLCRA